MDRPIRDLLVQAGAKREVLYCPAFHAYYKTQLGNIDRWWNYSSDGCVLSYFCLIERNGPDPANMRPGKYFHSRLIVTNATEIELFTDVVISESPDTNNFTRITSTSGIVPFHTTSHLVKDNRPAGGNILFADGHVSWRAAQRHEVALHRRQPPWFLVLAPDQPPSPSPVTCPRHRPPKQLRHRWKHGGAMFSREFARPV